jgi:lipopolysaccharide export system permease protein
MNPGFSPSSKSKFAPWFWVPRLSVMDRYIATELTLPFLFGVGAFSSIGVSVGAVFDMIRRIAEYGLSAGLALQIVLLKLPEFVAYSFPMSVLLATLITYSRLSSDSELVALRGCGVSVYRLVLPAIVLCCIVTGMTFALNEMVVPAANYRAAVTLAQAFDEAKPSFREENIVYQDYEQVREKDGDADYELKRIFYARRFDGTTMKGLTVLDFSRQGLAQIISAQSADWDFSKGLWHFYNGTIYAVSSDGSFRSIATFKDQELRLPRQPFDIASRNREPSEMNIAEMMDYLRLIEPTGNQKKILELQVRLQQKFAIPFICIAFGLVGAALGTQLRKTGRATGFAISIVIIFGYYLCIVTTGAIAQVGLIPPFLGAWIPNLFGLISGTFLLIRASR